MIYSHSSGEYYLDLGGIKMVENLAGSWFFYPSRRAAECFAGKSTQPEELKSSFHFIFSHISKLYLSCVRKMCNKVWLTLFFFIEQNIWQVTISYPITGVF